MNEPSNMSQQALLSPSVPEQLARTIPAVQSKAVETKNALAIILAQVYAMCGRNIAAKDLSVETQALQNLIMADFPFLSVQEIRVAMLDGIKADAHLEYIELSQRRYYAWLSDYRQGEKRRCVSRIRRKLSRAALPGISDRQKDIHRENLCIRIFDDYKEKGYMRSCGWVVYDILNKKGVIRLTREEKLDVFRRAEEKMARELPSPHRSRYRIIVEAKEAALRDFFDAAIRSGRDMASFLNMK